MSTYASLKEECCEANKELPNLGIVDLTFGNVSIVDRDREAMAIKPSGGDYDVPEPVREESNTCFHETVNGNPGRRDLR